MKAISTTAIITRLSSRVDRSIGVSFTTPELSSDEKSLFFELQGINSRIEIAPLDSEPTETVKIDKDLETKTPGQRLRSVLFILWRRQGQKEAFEEFYRLNMERLIEAVKAKLEN
jgi:hypothetical protein